MKLRELVRPLTKYYAVYITNHSICFEDQTVLPDAEMNKEVEAFDFYESGEGEMLLVSLKSEQVDDRQITFDDLKELA